MEEENKEYAHIKGWGIDADPENEPTYPMKNYTGDDHQRINWKRPPLQPVNVEVLHSNERPTVSAVFGTANPPSGLSGALRRFAFKYSESSYGHWLPLLLADRVNVLEGIAEDLSKGHIPNIFAEKGWKAKWKHNPQGLITQAVVGTIITVSLIAYLTKNKKKRRLF